MECVKNKNSRGWGDGSIWNTASYITGGAELNTSNSHVKKSKNGQGDGGAHL